MSQCDECGNAVEKIHRCYKQRNYCHKCYVRVFKKEIAHHVVKAQDCTKLINWLFAKNVKLIAPVFDVNVLITP